MARGRPPLLRNVYRLDEPLLDVHEVVVDTSVVVAALFSQQRDHSSCVEFFDHVAERETVVFYNELLVTELHEASYRVALKERWGKDWARKRHDGRSRRRARGLAEKALASWEQLLDHLDHGSLRLEDAQPYVPRMMGDHGMGSYDAVHAVTAELLGVDTIATTDHGIAALPARRFRLLVPPARVRTFRARRIPSAGRSSYPVRYRPSGSEA